MLTRSGLVLSLFILSLPITVRMGRDSLPDDTTTRVLAGTMRRHETRLTVGAGAGSFGIVDRGCENEFLRSQEFRQRDVGGDLEQHVSGPLSVGVRAGAIHERVTLTEAPSVGGNTGTTTLVTHSTRENAYFNPYFRVGDRSAEVSAGGIVFRDPFQSGNASQATNAFSLGLRAGRLDRLAFRASWMEGVPLLSQSDQFVVGAESWGLTNLGLFVGVAAGPRHGSFLLRGQWWVAPEAALNFSGRIGPEHANVTTGGVSIGLTLRAPPPEE